MTAALGAAPGSAAAPEAIAPLAVYLLSRLSGDLNGQLLRLDGEELSVLSRPRTAAAVVKGDGWTIADIAAAVESAPLRDALKAR
jgi:hypothetical protein